MFSGTSKCFWMAVHGSAMGLYNATVALEMMFVGQTWAQYKTANYVFSSSGVYCQTRHPSAAPHDTF